MALDEITTQSNRRPVIIYDAEFNRQISVAAACRQLISGIWTRRELTWELFKRDFLASYKRSFLGYIWLLITPIFSILSWLLFNRIGVLKPGAVDVPYPIYVLVGTSFWSLFMSSVGAAAGVFTSGAGLLNQIKYPHEIMIWKALAQAISQFGIMLVLIIFSTLFSGTIIHWPFVFIPLCIIPLILLGLSIGLVLAALNVVMPDLYSAANYALGFLIFLSPIIYSREVLENGPLGQIAKFDPLTYLVCSPRDLLLKGELYSSSGFVFSSLFAVLTFLLAWRAFLITEPRLVERLQ